MRPSLLLAACLSIVSLLWTAPVSAAGPSGPGWMQLREAPVTFHFRAQDEGVAEALAQQTPRRIEEIRTTTGLPVPRHIDVVLAPTFELFAEVQPGNPPVWAAGTAYDERSEVYLRTRMPRVGADPIDQVYVHELVHILLGRSFVAGHPPRWLNEGLARLLAHEFRPNEQMELTRAALAGGLLELDSITRHWPRRARAASLAYAQSADFTAFLADLGDDVLPRLIEQLASGVELGVAVEDTTGERLSVLEARWSKRISFWHAFLPVVGGSGFLWGIASAIFGVAAFRKRRQVKRRIANMPTGRPTPVKTRPLIVDGVPRTPPSSPQPSPELSVALFGARALEPDPSPEYDPDEHLLRGDDDQDEGRVLH